MIIIYMLGGFLVALLYYALGALATGLLIRITRGDGKFFTKKEAVDGSMWVVLSLWPVLLPIGLALVALGLLSSLVPWNIYRSLSTSVAEFINRVGGLRQPVKLGGSEKLPGTRETFFK